jgi:hypothetical protein
MIPYTDVVFLLWTCNAFSLGDAGSSTNTGDLEVPIGLERWVFEILA